MRLYIPLLCALVGIVIYLNACASSLSPSQQRALEAHKCYVTALEPALGPLTEDILRAILAGGNPAAILKAHRVSSEDAETAYKAWVACDVAGIPNVPRGVLQ